MAIYFLREPENIVIHMAIYFLREPEYIAIHMAIYFLREPENIAIHMAMSIFTRTLKHCDTYMAIYCLTRT